MYWQPGLSETLASLQSQIDALDAAQIAVEAALDANYRVDVRTGSPLAPVAVGVGATVLCPLPNVSAAPKSWPVGIWTRSGAGVIFGSNDVAGVYEIGLSLTFSDTAAAPITWTWLLVQGHDLATVPVTFDRVVQECQLTMLSDPDGVTLHGIFQIPDTGADFEFGLFAAHNGGGALNVTIRELQFNLTKVGDLDQV